jgi:hypothetical protein
MNRDEIEERDRQIASLAEVQSTINLRHDADMRAIKQWQEAHPERELVWPDHVDLVVWLMEQIAALTANIENMDKIYHGTVEALTAWNKELEADALVKALRLLGEDDNSFGPECHEVMKRWGEIARQTACR